jgi:hypothetical protein
VQDNAWAIGSGAQAVLGYFAGLTRAGTDINTGFAHEAIRFAAELNADVGTGTHVETLLERA